MFDSIHLFGQKKSLILLIYFNRLQLYIWSTKSLELAGEFGKAPVGCPASQFRLYSQQSVVLGNPV